MSRLSTAGVTAVLAVVLACAGLADSAATSSGDMSAPRLHATPTPADRASAVEALAPAERDTALATAKTEAASVAESLRLTSAQTLHVTDVERDVDGTVHVRYRRTLGGLPVMGGDLVVHQSSSGQIQDADFATSQPLVLSTGGMTKVGPLQAARLSARADAVGSSAGPARKVVWAVDGVPRLAWLTKIRAHHAGGTPAQAARRAVVIDASTGKPIQSWDLHQEATGRGRSLYSGSVRLTTQRKGGRFLLKDPSRGGSTTVDVHNLADRTGFHKGTVFSDGNNVWGSGREGNRQSAATDVAYGVAKTWDYYLKTFGREGIRNNGRGARSRVHYGRNYDNAFWNDRCFCMTYGDGGLIFKPLVSVDVAGHEMSHGVTSATAGLYYFGDAGGLNEASSDIFGSMVEFYARNPENPGNYHIGEQIVRPRAGKYLRRMDNPALDGLSYNCWNTRMGLDDPHFTSGPANHFFYLLAEGSGAKRIGGYQHRSRTCDNAPRVQGVGRARASQIWYRALTRYFVSTTGYIDARDATIRAAVDLYGAGSGVCKQVVKAWNAVAVPRQDWTCDGALVIGPNTFTPSRGFEADRGAWTTTGKAVITDNRSVGLPRTGRFYGNFSVGSRSGRGSFAHTITVPDTPTATLRFYLLMRAGGRGTVDVLVNGNLIPDHAGHFDQRYANNTYQRWDVPVSQWAGRTLPMSIRIATSRGGYFQVLLDDFTLTPR